MKICCFGDLHYSGTREWLLRIIEDYIASTCNDEDVDVVIVVGDITSTGNFDHLREVLELLRGELVTPYVMVVPGNHDIYVFLEEQGVDSLVKLQLFNDMVEEAGFIALMKKPFILDNVGFVGSIGWYDYSFAPDYLGLSLEDFKVKAFGLSVWADRDYVRLPMNDEEFALQLLNMFEEHIKQIYNSVERIVIALHHVPFRRIVKYRLEPSWDYFSTFMGSENFGYIIKKYSNKIKLVVYGHQHGNVVTRVCNYIDNLKCCNCASPIPLVIEL